MTQVAKDTGQWYCVFSAVTKQGHTYAGVPSALWFAVATLFWPCAIASTAINFSDTIRNVMLEVVWPGLKQSRHFPGHRAAPSQWPQFVCSHLGWELGQSQLPPLTRWRTAGPPVQHRTVHRNCQTLQEHRPRVPWQWLRKQLNCVTQIPSQRTGKPLAAIHPVHNSRDNSVRDNHSVGLVLWQKGVFYACGAELTLFPLPVCF